MRRGTIPGVQYGRGREPIFGVHDGRGEGEPFLGFMMVEERCPSLGFTMDKERGPIPGGCCFLDLGFMDRSRTGSGRFQFLFRDSYPGVLRPTLRVQGPIADGTTRRQSSRLLSCAQASFSATVEILLLESHNSTHEFPLLSKVLL